MPIQACTTDGKPGYQWGASGACFTYDPDSDETKKAARKRARAQAVAILYSSGMAEALDALLEIERRDRKPRQLEPVYESFRKALEKIFEAEGARVLGSALPDFRTRIEDAEAAKAVGESLREARQITDEELDRVFGLATGASIDEIARVISEQGTMALQLGAASTLADSQFVISWELTDERARTYFAEHALEKATGIDEATRSDLKRIVSTALDEGRSYTQVANDITKKYAEFATPQPQLHIRNRAELIAVTETADAYEAGRVMVIDELNRAGLTVEKFWLTVGDDRVDPDCEANESAGWIPSDAPFPSGDDRPPAHPACRCDEEIRVVSDEQEGPAS